MCDGAYSIKYRFAQQCVILIVLNLKISCFSSLASRRLMSRGRGKTFSQEKLHTPPVGYTCEILPESILAHVDPLAKDIARPSTTKFYYETWVAVHRQTLAVAGKFTSGKS